MIAINNILIIDLMGSTTYKSFKSYGFPVAEPYEHRKKSDYRKRNILHKLRMDDIPLINSVFKINSELTNNYDPQIIIIMGSLIFEHFIYQLRYLFPTSPIAYCYKNIVSSQASIHPAILKKYNIIGYSWDIEDCKKYGLRYQSPSIDPTLFDNIQSDIKVNDVCFIGVDKGRYKIIKAIEQVISKAGYSSYIHITPDHSYNKIGNKVYKDKISYQHYLKIVATSSCYIDIVQKGQVGTTTRTMEALFTNKKIISNNSKLKEYDFYNPNNIFILTENNINDIPSFLKLPYIPIKKEMLQKYELKNSINQIIKTLALGND